MLQTMRNIKLSKWCVFYDMFYTLTISIYIASNQPDKHIVSVCVCCFNNESQLCQCMNETWVLMLDIISLIILHIHLDTLYQGDTLFIGYCCHFAEMYVNTLIHIVILADSVSILSHTFLIVQRNSIDIHWFCPRFGDYSAILVYYFSATTKPKYHSVVKTAIMDC